MKKRKLTKNNYQFVDNLLVNDMTYIDYLERFKKIALSIFEWVNLPKSMNAQYLEKCLYYNGMASLLKDDKYGFINTNCASNGYVNIYGLPSSLNCYSYDYQSSRILYTGLLNNENIDDNDNECILVQNNWERTPTCRYFRIICITSL